MTTDRAPKEAKDQKNRRQEGHDSEEAFQIEAAAPLHPDHANILHLQRTIGNQAVQRLMAQGRLTPQGTHVQTKPSATEAEEAEELEQESVETDERISMPPADDAPNQPPTNEHSIQRRYDIDYEPHTHVPEPPVTPEAVGLPSAAKSAQDPQAMEKYLASQSYNMVDLQNNLEKANPQTPEDKAALQPQLERMIRLNAIGMMASHRAHVTDARDQLLSGAKRREVAKQPDNQSDSAFTEMRQTANVVNQLNDIKDELANSQRHLHAAHSAALFRRGDVADVLEQIFTYGEQYSEADKLDNVRDNLRGVQSPQNYWLVALGASDYLEKYRQQQIIGVQQAISRIYEVYPLFAELDAEDVNSDENASDKELLKSSEKAYAKVIERIDEAIGDIATNDIHPFDLPKAVEITKANLPPPAIVVLDQATHARQMRRFWLNTSMTLLEAMVVFIPVVGPIIAVGMGAAQLGMNLEDMLDRLTQAQSSTDPYSTPLGVEGPSKFEWLMAGVQAILVAFGAVMVGRAIKGSGAAGTSGKRSGSSLFEKPTTTGDPTMPAGTGGTDPFGNIAYSTQGSATDQALVLYHEQVHSFLSPRFKPLRAFRAQLGMAGYNKSALLRYVEEALAESVAQLRVNGIRGLPEGLRFPIANGYVTLGRVVGEAAVGTVVYGGITYGVYVTVSEPEKPESTSSKQTDVEP